MAGTEVTDLLLRIRGETGDAEQAVGRVGKSFTELNSAAELAKKAFNALQIGAQAFMAVVERGQGVSELTASFNALQKQAGSLATVEMPKLREATQGLVSDTDLMRAANEALLSGLSPKQFEDLAKAADTLGDAVGINTTDALNQLTLAANTGQERLLKMYGIVIDNKKAEEDFAKTLGVSADQLNELGKKEAARLAIIDKIKQKSEELAAATAGGPGTIADALTQAGNAAGTFYDRFADFVNNSPRIAAAIQQATQQLTDLGNAITGSGKAAIDAQIRLKEQGLKELQNPDLLERAVLAAFPGETASQTQARLIAKTTEELKALNVERDKITDGEVRKQLEAELLVWEPEGKEIEKNRQKFTEHTKAKKENTDETKKLIAAQDQLKASLQQLNDANSLRPLSDAVSKAFSDGFTPEKAQQAFGAYIQEFGRITQGEFELKAGASLHKGTTDGLIAGIKDAKVAAETYAFQQRLEEANKEAFQNSVSFFSDLFNSAIDGSAKNFEDIFKDVAKRIAIGFASQMAANLFGALGLGGVGQIGSAQGLGQVLAASVGFGGGGIKPLTSILGGAAGAGGVPLLSGLFGGTSATGGVTGSIGGVSGGFTGITAGGGIGGSAALGSSSLLSTFGPFGAGAAVLGGSILGGSLLASGVGSKDPFSGGIGGGILGGSLLGGLGASVLGPLGALASFGGIFGGDSQKAQERQDREDLLNKLKDQFGSLSFGTVGGTGTLDAKNFNVGSGPLSGQGASFGNTFAQLLTGGDGKLSSDLAAIFENAVDGAKNFNEQLVNVQSAFDKFGLDANKAKGDIQNLFLDGKISAAEFGASLENLNKIQQHVFTGPNGIQEGIDIISSSLQDSPRVALEALADEFNTLAQAGYQSTTDIAGYFTNNMQPELAAVFQKLGDLGVKSFDDVAGAIAQNPDLVFAIISAIQSLNKEIDTADSKTQKFATTANNKDADTGAVFKKAQGAAKDYNDEVDRAISKTKTLSDLVSGGNRGGDSGTSQKLNTTPP